MTDTGPYGDDAPREWRVPDPDPIHLTYPESRLVYAALRAQVRYRQRRLEHGEGDPVRDQRQLDRALNVIDKLDTASKHPAASRERRSDAR